MTTITKNQKNATAPAVQDAQVVLSDIEAEFALMRLAETKRDKAALAEREKEITASLEAYARANASRFKGQTMTLEHGKLAWVNKTEVTTPKDFDEYAFYKEHPIACNIKLIPGTIKEWFKSQELKKSLRSFGISLEQKATFTVTPIPLSKQ